MLSNKEIIVHTCRICKKSDICKGEQCEFSEVLQAHLKCKTKNQS